MIVDVQRFGRASISLALAAFGVACLLFSGIATLSAWRYQHNAKAELSREATVERSAPALKPPAHGELIGRIEIPRLKLSAAVAEGDDDKTLAKAVGHLPETPLPWHRHGNMALAAHRDGLFRRLEHIRPNDEVRVVTPRGDFFYSVRRTRIVEPDDVSVIAHTAAPTITLITCYPFSFVGNAPQRFVVQAELVGDVTGRPLKGTVQSKQ
jgi:sortase A